MDWLNEDNVYLAKVIFQAESSKTLKQLKTIIKQNEDEENLHKWWMQLYDDQKVLADDHYLPKITNKKLEINEFNQLIWEFSVYGLDTGFDGQWTFDYDKIGMQIANLVAKSDSGNKISWVGQSYFDEAVQVGLRSGYTLINQDRVVVATASFQNQDLKQYNQLIIDEEPLGFDDRYDQFRQKMFDQSEKSLQVAIIKNFNKINLGAKNSKNY